VWLCDSCALFLAFASAPDPPAPSLHDALPIWLASSPEAIYQSLRRRRERLEERLRELELLQKGASFSNTAMGPLLDPDDMEDLEDAPENEIEETEKAILDQATAARTITELKLDT